MLTFLSLPTTLSFPNPPSPTSTLVLLLQPSQPHTCIFPVPFLRLTNFTQAFRCLFTPLYQTHIFFIFHTSLTLPVSTPYFIHRCCSVLNVFFSNQSGFSLAISSSSSNMCCLFTPHPTLLNPFSCLGSIHNSTASNQPRHHSRIHNHLFCTFLLLLI